MYFFEIVFADSPTLPRATLAHMYYTFILTLTLTLAFILSLRASVAHENVLRESVGAEVSCHRFCVLKK
jgi:hypothetical protein